MHYAFTTHIETIVPTYFQNVQECCKTILHIFLCMHVEWNKFIWNNAYLTCESIQHSPIFMASAFTDNLYIIIIVHHFPQSFTNAFIRVFRVQQWSNTNTFT